MPQPVVNPLEPEHVVLLDLFPIASEVGDRVPCPQKCCGIRDSLRAFERAG